MYLTDASRFLISCVIQHYAPVVGWGEEEQMHNVLDSLYQSCGSGMFIPDPGS
jgi:hypothetical protein